ncbi:hypothetical protein RAB80_002081 [Fusarium oxysporum f. sp. vasinfectum]|nr:hypothetical protein RAB80_002081 [Fusarium oxysporum f. sp. vasinfectum]
MFACGTDNLSLEAQEMADKLQAAAANVGVVQLQNAAHEFDKALLLELDAFE